ncbi:MAG: hypothetical protein Q9218_007485, partial [Villophora microphyllina]
MKDVGGGGGGDDGGGGEEKRKTRHQDRLNCPRCGSRWHGTSPCRPLCPQCNKPHVGECDPLLAARKKKQAPAVKSPVPASVAPGSGVTFSAEGVTIAKGGWIKVLNNDGILQTITSGGSDAVTSTVGKPTVEPSKTATKVASSSPRVTKSGAGANAGKNLKNREREEKLSRAAAYHVLPDKIKAQLSKEEVDEMLHGRRPRLVTPTTGANSASSGNANHERLNSASKNADKSTGDNSAPPIPPRRDQPASGRREGDKSAFTGSGTGPSLPPRGEQPALENDGGVKSASNVPKADNAGVNSASNREPKLRTCFNDPNPGATWAEVAKPNG